MLSQSDRKRWGTKPNCVVALLFTPQNHRIRGRHQAICPRTDSRRQRKQFLFPDLQCPRQKDDLGVRHTTNLRLDFGNGVLTNVPTDSRATCRQHSLRPSLAVTNFSHDGTDDVLRSRFAHDFALTVCEWGLVFLPISEETVYQQTRDGHLPPRLRCMKGNLSGL